MNELKKMKSAQFHGNVFTAPIYFDSWIDK